ncbi:MAG TPA: Uma2 family endonuclease [Pyrinomonadaceae bacterium]|nr:Uma2 family endonuclease [Pyrinomonadaceae bacterium]
MPVIEVPAELNFSPLLRRYTLEEFWSLPEREDRVRYELIAGCLFMVPPPDPPHGDVAARMTRALMKFVIENDVKGDVHHPHSAIWKHAIGSTYLEPDMMYVSRALQTEMGDDRPSADIVFEHLSESSNIDDRTTKADTYLLLGVRELWLIDPVKVTIEVRHAYQDADIATWETFVYSHEEHAKSRVLKGWEVSVAELFDGLV